jgi:iron complex outermembrane receptor protein
MVHQSFTARLASFFIACSALGVAANVRAQDSTRSTDDDVLELQEVTVTGTLIQNPNLTASAPVAVIGADEVALRQSTSAEEILRSLPGVVAGLGPQVAVGNLGAAFVDLRGLGSFRNIVLLDGRRITPASVVGRVDLNNIPLALIERTESLTGGAATTYGADAITGVINFITRKNFQGVEFRASDQATQDGEGNRLAFDATLGGNFAEDKGNLVLSLGYQKSQEIITADRDFSVFQYNSLNGELAGSNNTVPGIFTLGTANRVIDIPTGALRTIVNATDSFNSNNYLNLQAPFERYNLFASGNYEVNERIKIYSRALFSRNLVTSLIAPPGLAATSLTFPISNPYIPAAARAQFCASNDFNPNLAGIQTITQTGTTCDLAAAALTAADPNFRTFTTTVSRRFTELGARINNYTTTVYDFVAGTDIGLTDNISLDLSAGYGESTNRQARPDLALIAPIRSAIYATNRTTCLSGAPAGDPLINAAGTCVPINLFGPSGSITPAMLPYIIGTAYSANNASLAQARALVNGETGFAAPWATEQVNFAAGAEFRQYKAGQQSDILSKTPGAIGGSAASQPDFTGGYDVREFYGELIAPLVQGKRGVEELTLEAGVRQSKYTIDAPSDPGYSAVTYKFGTTWKPVDSLKLRGNYQHAVRAPNIAELFLPPTTAGGRLLHDPCAGADPLTNANLRAVCLAQGVPAAAIGSLQDSSQQRVGRTSGGDSSLGPEIANTVTVGVVFQPTFVAGLSVSLDYYRIKLDDAISLLSVDDAVAACFGSLSASSATSVACGPSFFRRDPVTGSLDGDLTVLGVLTPASNAGKAFTDGLDMNVIYLRDLGFAKLNLNFQGNYTHSSKFQATPTAIYRECVGYYSPNCGSPASNNPSADPNLSAGSLQPEYSWNLRSTLEFRKIDASLLWHHISSMQHEPIDAFVPFVGVLPQGQLAGQTVDWSHTPTFDTFDLTARYHFTENLEVTGTVINVLDKDPPLVGSTIGTSAFNVGNTYPSTYDPLGRRFALSVKLRL